MKALSLQVFQIIITRVRHKFETVKERSGSVVECLTPDRGIVGSNLTGVTALRP